MSEVSWFDKMIRDYGPYVDDLWKRIHRIVVFFVIIFIIGFFSAGYIIKYVITSFHLTNVTLVATSPFQFFNLSVDVSLFLALIITVPFLIYNFYSFLRPAVSKSEFRYLLTTLPVSFILFVFGFVYGFFALYLGLKVLAKVNIFYGISNYWDIGIFISQIFITATLLGILFQFPILIYILIKLGIFNRDFLKQKRRFAYAIIVVIVALLPPTDGLSMLIMSVPFVLMYEFIILSTYKKPIKQDQLPLGYEDS